MRSLQCRRPGRGVAGLGVYVLTVSEPTVAQVEVDLGLFHNPAIAELSVLRHSQSRRSDAEVESAEADNGPATSFRCPPELGLDDAALLVLVTVDAHWMK